MIGLNFDAINALPKTDKMKVLGSGTAIAFIEKTGYPGCPKAVLPVISHPSSDVVVASVV